MKSGILNLLTKTVNMTNPDDYSLLKKVIEIVKDFLESKDITVVLPYTGMSKIIQWLIDLSFINDESREYLNQEDDTMWYCIHDGKPYCLVCDYKNGLMMLNRETYD